MMGDLETTETSRKFEDLSNLVQVINTGLIEASDTDDKQRMAWYDIHGTSQKILIKACFVCKKDDDDIHW